MRPSSKQKKSSAREFASTLFWSLLLFMGFRASVAEAYRIPTESMMNTLLVGDFLFASKFEYGPKVPFTDARLPGLRKAQSGDVIVFRFPLDRSINYVKRCIATEGQIVEIRHKQVYVDGRRLDEPYARHIDPRELPAEISARDNMAPLRVPPGRLFMMGDNRDNSYDSRFWGTLSMVDVQGRAIFTYYSTGGNSWWSYLPRTRFDRVLRPIR